jgi:6-phosphogluconolactonase/glucosamine-6-phosphate isomerase/deaminase
MELNLKGLTQPFRSRKDTEKVIELPYPNTQYFIKHEEFHKAVSKDFVATANKVLAKGGLFLVGLAHGQSPAGAYRMIFNNYHRIKKPENIRYTFINSPLERQRGLSDVFDASNFIKKLFREGHITKDQVLGTSFQREALEDYAANFNKIIGDYLNQQNKKGLDYVFLASDPTGKVAAIDRHSKAFESKEIALIVDTEEGKELTATPYFLLQSGRVAFLATKSDKRRPLAWLYSPNGKPNESPSFLRYLEDVENRMTVFIDNDALTWPQVEIIRETPYGNSEIRLDLPIPYNPDSKEKLPVIIMIHGFLGLNSFDGLLTMIPTHQYIAAAMHYGTIPNDLPPSEYSHHVTKNIEKVVEYFGEKGHPVYIFDHSMSNTYFMMFDRNPERYKGIGKYLRGRIGANSFFGEEAKHAILGFLDYVIIPGVKFTKSPGTKTIIQTFRQIVPLDTKRGVRAKGIDLTGMLIQRETEFNARIWNAAKGQVLYLMTNMDSIPHLNRIPVGKALNRLPSKIFAIQSHSALEESKCFDKQEGLLNTPKMSIPVLMIKSEKDGIAKFVPRLCQSENVEILDVTNEEEKNLFKEHLYHMVEPEKTAEIIDRFITECEKKHKTKKKISKVEVN